MGFIVSFAFLLLAVTFALALIRASSLGNGLREGLLSFVTTALVVGAVAVVIALLGR